MPRKLVLSTAQKYLVERGLFKTSALPDVNREAAVQAMAEVFDVNPAVARIRLVELFPNQTAAQGAL